MERTPACGAIWPAGFRLGASLSHAPLFRVEVWPRCVRCDVVSRVGVFRVGVFRVGVWPRCARCVVVSRSRWRRSHDEAGSADAVRPERSLVVAVGDHEYGAELLRTQRLDEGEHAFAVCCVEPRCGFVEN